MKQFAKINQKYDYDYLTPFWLQRSLILEKALQILHDTIIVGDSSCFYGNIKKYLQHIKEYNKISNGFNESQSIIEWGGGLGMMADIIIKKYQHIQTYVIIDIPIMTYIQSKYFTLRGIPHHILSENCKNIKPGINLAALPFIDDMRLWPDMFISTWAISESGKKSLKYGSEHRLFKCKHVLIAHNRHELEDFPDSPLYGIVDCKKVAIDEHNEYIIR